MKRFLAFRHNPRPLHQTITITNITPYHPSPSPPSPPSLPPPRPPLTSAGEYIRIQLAVSFRETLHHSVYLLALPWQSEAPQELPQRLHQDQVTEIVQVDEGREDGDVEVVAFSEVVPDRLLVEALAFVQEFGDVWGEEGKTL